MARVLFCPPINWCLNGSYDSMFVQVFSWLDISALELKTKVVKFGKSLCNIYALLKLESGMIEEPSMKEKHTP